MTKRIVVWLAPEVARVKFSALRPPDWDEMSGEERLEYFANHMLYANDNVISRHPDPDWYDGVDPLVDFEEEDV